MPNATECRADVFITGEERMKKLSYRVLVGALLSMMIIPGAATGQNTTRPKKVLTPEQQEFQRKVASYLIQRKALQEQAAKAFDAEIAREKAGDCKNASSTLDIETCLGKESEITETNYLAFTGAIRELLSLSYPEFSRPAASVASGRAAKYRGSGEGIRCPSNRVAAISKDWN